MWCLPLGYLCICCDRMAIWTFLVVFTLMLNKYLQENNIVIGHVNPLLSKLVICNLHIWQYYKSNRSSSLLSFVLTRYRSIPQADVVVRHRHPSCKIEECLYILSRQDVSSLCSPRTSTCEAVSEYVCVMPGDSSFHHNYNSSF